MTTIIVSPFARLTASRTPPTTPGSAAGSNTLRTVSELVAPIARLSSRIAEGTAAIESSAIDGTKGMNIRSEEYTSELQPLTRISYAVFCLKQDTREQHKSQIYNQHHI